MEHLLNLWLLLLPKASFEDPFCIMASSGGLCVLYSLSSGRYRD